MPKKGRARRFREAREMKQGYDDGLFKEGSGTLADTDSGVDDLEAVDADWEAPDAGPAWDADDPLKADDR